MRRYLLLALCALAAAAIVVELLVAGDDDHKSDERAGRSTSLERPRAPARPPSADAFLDSIGVAMHLNYIDTAYGRQAEVLDRLREFGVRHVRDGFPYRAPALERGLRGLAALGVRGTLVTDMNLPVQVGVTGGARAMGSRLEAFEGPNELDRSTIPDWPARLRRYMPALRDAMRAAGSAVPLVGPSFVDVNYYRLLDRASYDVVSLHLYPDALAPEGRLRERLAEARAVVGSRRVAITETGYTNAFGVRDGPLPTSEKAAGVYMPRTFLWAFDAGVERTFAYELVDQKPDPGQVDPEQHFGLMRQDLTRKPAFLAVRNLIRAVRRSPGAATTSPPAASVQSAERLERVDLTRADGSRVVALWRPVPVWDRDRRRDVDPGRVAARVTWPRSVRDLTVSRPSSTGAPVRHSVPRNRLDLELAGDVVLLSYR